MEHNELFGQEELLTLREFAINPYDTVFYKPSFFSRVKPLSAIDSKKSVKKSNSKSTALAVPTKILPPTGELYICHLRLTDGLYAFTEPQPRYPENGYKLSKRSAKRIAKYIAVTEKKLLLINNTHTRKLMASAKKNAEFVERFNRELFFKHCFYQGNRISIPELFRFFQTHPYYELIDLSQDADKLPFMVLYAMAFYAIPPQDLFTVDGIFSMQPERHADNAKKTAGNSVFNLILRNHRAETEKVLLTMGKALMNIAPLQIDLNDPVMLSKNYTLFAGLSEIGRVFLQVTEKFTAGAPADMKLMRTSAKDLLKYAPLVHLCDTISVLSDSEDYKETAAFQKCKELF